MKRVLVISILAVFLAFGYCDPSWAYNDQRGHNLDSLERIVGLWTPDALDKASAQELLEYNRACRDLMLGYSNINGEKCIFYARRALSVSLPQGWQEANADAFRYLGQQYYGREEYDTALVYYGKALEAVEAMAGGATSITNPEGYDDKTIDDERSALYGAIGNLYNMMDSIPQAMVYYDKAGVIFEKYGWNESSSILHYNMGETWLDEGDKRKALSEYEKALDFAEASGDSLMIVGAWKGLGRYYMEARRPRKSLSFLRKADAYYAAHPDYSPAFRQENLDVMKEVLSGQKMQLGRLVGILVALVLVSAGFVLSRRRHNKTSNSSELASEKKPLLSNAPKLSDRELEILDLLSKGYTAPQIAEALNLSHETIRWHRKNLISKFEASNTAELISIAKDLGMV